MKKKVTVIVVAALAAVLVVCGALAMVFMLRALWTDRIRNDMIIPSRRRSCSVTMLGSESSDGFTLKYRAERQGAWLYIRNGNEYVIAVDDTVYDFLDTDDGPEVREIYSRDTLEYLLSKRNYQYEVNKYLEISDIILGNLDRSMKSAWRWGDTYKAELDKQFLFDENFDDFRFYEEFDIELGDFDCTMRLDGCRLGAMRLTYDYSRLTYSDTVAERKRYEKNFEFEFEYGDECAEIELPELFAVYEERISGDLLKSSASYRDRYMETGLATDDGAVTFYVDEYDDVWDNNVYVYPEYGVLLSERERSVDIFSFPDLKKLHSVEYRVEVAGARCIAGRLVVLASGFPVSGLGALGDEMPRVTSAYIYELPSMKQTQRYVISGDVGDEITAVAADENSLLFYDGAIKRLDISTGQVSDAPDASLSEGDTEEEVRYYPTPLGLSSPDYAGFEFGKYDLVELIHPDSFGLYDREDEEYDYLFPAGEQFGHGEEFVYDMGGGRYMCFVERRLFLLDMNKVQPRHYDNYIEMDSFCGQVDGQ